MAFSIQQTYRRNVAVLALLLALLVVVQVFVFGFFQLRHDQERALTHQALMIAGQFDSSGDGSAGFYRGKLNQAIVNPQLAVGCVVNHEGAVIATQMGHAAADLGITERTTVKACRYFMKTGSAVRFLVARAPITDATLPKATGEIVLVGAPSTVWEHFGTRLLSFLSIVLAFGLLCLWQGQRLLRFVIKPIRQIATTAQRVTLYKDYSLRVTTGALTQVPQEVDLLIESFNAMLKEVEDRDSRLMRKTVELEKARQHADAANIAKSQFLANVSHELRTPLNAIIGFSTILTDQKYGALGHAKYHEYAHDIHESGKHLLDVINDILDLSKAEAGKLTVRFELLSLAKVVEKAVSIVAGQAHDAKVDVYTDIPEKLPRIVADRVRLVQILLNLLSNAIKFTHTGGKVVVRARAETGKGHVHFFTIEVEDNGIGMTDEEIRKAFVSFNQADAGLNRKFEGAGLGLPLTKRLVELHHGKLKIESIKGHGTTVVVRLTSDPALLD